MNNVCLIGNMTRDPETRQAGDKTVCNFTLAVNRPWKTDEVDFIRCQVWGRGADNTAQYCSKGSKVGVTGRLSVRQYEKDGEKKTFAEVVCDRVQFLTPKNEYAGMGQEVDDGDCPF